jgi:RNA polymerase sigma-70 factor (ECF subfamily)
MIHAEDARWAAAVREFEAVALPHVKELYRVAARMVADSTRADDVLQDVYFQAWKSFGSFEPGTNCRAWLFRILINAVRHHRRKWFPARVVPDGNLILENAPSYSAPIPETISDDEILSALDLVPAEFREVVLLVDVEECSYKDVSAILGIPIGTVMSRLSRGRALLRKRLHRAAESHGIGKASRAGQGA